MGVDVGAATLSQILDIIENKLSYIA